MKKLQRDLQILLLLFMSVATVYADGEIPNKLSLKLSGGYGFLSIGDLNTEVKDWNGYFSGLAGRFDQYNLEGRWHELKGGMDFAGEFIWNLSGNMGISLGAGYIQSEDEGTTTLEIEPFFSGVWTLHPQISVIPFKLSALYSFPTASRMRIFIKGGAGLYLGKFTYSYQSQENILGALPLIEKAVGEAKDKGLGLHGGMGIEFDITGRLNLFIETEGRYCRLKDWRGDEVYSGAGSGEIKKSGVLWHYELYDPTLEKYHSVSDMSEEKPDDPGFRNVEKFVFDLSGISIRAGIKIKF